MIGIVERLRFDAARCELQFSKGVAGNIEEAAAKIERWQAALKQIMELGYHSLDPDVDKRMTEIAREALDRR